SQVVRACGRVVDCCEPPAVPGEVETAPFVWLQLDSTQEDDERAAELYAVLRPIPPVAILREERRRPAILLPPVEPHARIGRIQALLDTDAVADESGLGPRPTPTCGYQRVSEQPENATAAQRHGVRAVRSEPARIVVEESVGCVPPLCLHDGLRGLVTKARCATDSQDERAGDCRERLTPRHSPEVWPPAVKARSSRRRSMEAMGSKGAKIGAAG